MTSKAFNPTIWNAHLPLGWAPLNDKAQMVLTGCTDSVHQFWPVWAKSTIDFTLIIVVGLVHLREKPRIENHYYFHILQNAVRTQEKCPSNYTFCTIISGNLSQCWHTVVLHHGLCAHVYTTWADVWGHATLTPDKMHPSKLPCSTVLIPGNHLSPVL